ncbi:MAG: FliO/MopB family protein [Deltaproteobacteria bacterium]|nr:FliO/MopB family protein [Deltaproteobacteria bacterium]MBW2659575.1 FliO/MopB family protein [Deltaproteobacteria bacterium]
MKHYCHLLTFIPLFTCIFFISPGKIYGAETGLDVTSSYFRMIWGLLVVLGIILILYGVMKKRLSLFNSSASQSIKILELKPLMGKKAICLVEVKGKEYLLGIGNDQINHLASLEPENDSSFAETLRKTVPEKQND